MSEIFSNSLSPEQLEEMFGNDDKCLEFLAGIKWANGFVCKKCGNTNSCAGKESFSRRCTKCKAKETATNGTVFHGVKFPISKAFYIAYQVCKGKEDVSSYEFGPPTFVAPNDLLELQNQNPACTRRNGFAHRK